MPIKKYTIPSKYEPAAYGTVCEVLESEKPLDLYIQISKDDQAPNWMPMGAFLKLVFKQEIQEEKFIKECLEKIYE